MKPALGLADLVRLAAHLPWADVLELAHAQGFKRVDLAVLAPPTTAPPPPLPLDEATEHRHEAAASVPMPFWFLTRVEQAPRHWGDPPRGEVLRAADRHDPTRSITRAPVGDFAEPWSRLGPVLQALMAGRRTRRALDMPVLVRLLGRARRLNPMPRQTRSVWPSRIHVWVDRSERLVPLWRDQSLIHRHLQRLCGAAAVTAQIIDRARLWSFDPRVGVRPGDTVLVLGDLGALGDAALRERWRVVGELLDGHGAHPVALVVGDGSASWRCVRWSRGDPTAEATEALRVRASMAELVQPGLLRALRRQVPGAALADELAVWNDAGMLTTDTCGLVLEGSHLEGLRAQFAALDRTVRTAVSALIQHWHAQMPRELEAVETVAWHLSGGGVEVGHVGEALALLDRLAVTLHQAAPHEEAAWRQFAERACARLPVEARRDTAVKAVVERLERAAAGGRALQVAGDALPGIAASASGLTPGTRFAVRQVGAALHFAPCGEAWPSAPGPGSPLAWLEAGEPWVVVEQAGRKVWHPIGEPFALAAGHDVEVRSDRQVLRLDVAAQPAWASAAGRDRYGLWADLDLKSVRQRLRWIPPGRFVMGSPATEAGRWDNEGPQHEVVIERGFWLGDTPVTQALWQAAMGDNPSRFKGMERPVEKVSWRDTQRFLGRAGVTGLALPTEAQWEYACRAGTTTATWRGDDEAVRADIAWYGANSRETQPVKQKSANPWGAYDMLGNVWEWCADPWRDSYEGAAPGPGSSGAASYRVLRGGSWGDLARDVRAACRDGDSPGGRDGRLGFRLALQPVAEPGSPAGGGGVGPGRAPGGAGSRGPEARGRS